MLTANDVYRDFVTDGVASSGQHPPRKAEIRELLTGYEAAITAFSANGGLIFDTRANLFASLAHDANASAWVISDPTVGYNGIYRKLGASGAGSWTRVADLPYSFIRLNDAGAGTANAIIATSSIPLPGAASAALLVMNVFEANTGPVTIAANGAAAKPLKTNSGNDLAASYLTAGMLVSFIDDGTNFRLLSDVASAAIQAAAEAASAIAQAAAQIAEDARDAALGAVPSVFVSDRVALKALDTATITASFLRESGREGQFLWRTGDYSTQIAADPLEGIYVKSDAISATAGAWVRQAGYQIFGIDIRWFGAVPQGNPSDTTTAIQRAMNLAATIGAGKVKIPRAEWRLGKTTTETWQTTAMPVGMKDQYALLVPSGVMLEGDGFLSHLKRYVADALVVVLLAETTGSKVSNLRIDGNDTGFPITGTTYGSGAAIVIESLTPSEDRQNVLDTIWIRDTPGYGIGAGWGHRRGLTIRNIFIDGTGADGIDLKRENSGGFDAFGVVLDNILVENFGRTVTDGAQAGVDIRGYVTASNIHVRKFGAGARAGIRFRGGIAADGVIGGHRSSLTNYRVERISGGEATTYGLEVNCDGVSSSNGSVEGCTINVGHLIVGVTTGMSDVVHTGVHSFGAATYGFRTESQAQGVRFIGCSDYLSPVGFRIEGDDNKLVAPIMTSNSGGTGINIAATANNTAVMQPTYNGTITPMADAGTNTKVWQDGTFSSGTVRNFSFSGTGDSFPAALAAAGAAIIVADSVNADADIQLSTKGAGYHALGGAKTQTTVGAAGGATALPATPLGYLQVKIAGSIRKIPYYNN